MTRRHVVVNTLDCVRLCVDNLEASDPCVQDAAESVLSYLVLHLRQAKTIVPPELEDHLEALRKPAD